MAETTKTLSHDDAYNVLASQVHAPVFFQKLASVYGITPNTAEEARELLLIAARLRNAEEQREQKQASANTNFYAEARQNLDKALGQTVAAGTQDNAIKAAAADAAKNPLIREAAVVFSKHMAQTK